MSQVHVLLSLLYLINRFISGNEKAVSRVRIRGLYYK